MRVAKEVRKISAVPLQDLGIIVRSSSSTITAAHSTGTGAVYAANEPGHDAVLHLWRQIVR